MFMFPLIDLGDFVQVIDSTTRKVVIQGLVRYQKDGTRGKRFADENRLFSVDNTHFFKLGDNAYTVKKLGNSYSDDNFISENYKEISWWDYEIETNDKCDMVRENCIEELDKEVANVVTVLNKFSPRMAITGSCSGHGERPAHVDIRFEDLLTINDLMNVFVPYTSKIDLTTYPCITNDPFNSSDQAFSPRNVELRLKTKEVGEPAWHVLDELTEYLNTIIDVRSRFWNLQNKIIKKERDRITLGQD